MKIKSVSACLVTAVLFLAVGLPLDATLSILQPASSGGPPHASAVSF